LKLVKEHINFQRGLNPKDAMGIGDIKEREIQRVRKIMRHYMNAAMKEHSTIYPGAKPNEKLKFKIYNDINTYDLKFISYSFKIQREKFELKYYYNNPLWDLELNYGGMTRYINLPTTSIKDFIREIHLAMQDLDLR
jgi:hypothetical protein